MRLSELSTTAQRRFLLPVAVVVAAAVTGGYAVAQDGDDGQTADEAAVEAMEERGGAAATQDGVITPDEAEQYLTQAEIDALRNASPDAAEQRAAIESDALGEHSE